MSTNAQRSQIGQRTLLLSLVAWVILLVTPTSSLSHAHHALPGSGGTPASLPGAETTPANAMDHEHHAHHTPTDSGASQPAMLPDQYPAQYPATQPTVSSTMIVFASLLAGWPIMLVAMMSPTLIAPICHISERTFKRRRFRSVALFVAGYAAIWMGAGVILIAAALGLQLLMPYSYLPVIAVGIAALVWQCSPIKQRCLNRSHNHRELAAFGRTADMDVLHFGITHGLWCVGSCWLLMLLPMLVSVGHLALMALVTLVMIGERLDAPSALRWRLRPRGSLMRLMLFQSRLQWQKALSRKAS